MSSVEQNCELGEPLYVDYMCNDELCYFYRCRTAENQVLVVKSLLLGKFHVDGPVAAIIRRRYSNKIATNVRKLRQLGPHSSSVVRLSFSHPLFGPCSVTTEFHKYGNLFNWLANQTHLTLRTVCQVIQHVCVGLEYLHRNRIYHGNLGFRDILFRTEEPSSVAIVLDMSVRAELNKLCSPHVYDIQLCPPELLDAVCECANRWSQSAGRIYRTGEEMYQVDGLLRPTAERDMWCIGVMAHKLLTGKEPFFGYSLADRRACFKRGTSFKLTHPMFDTVSGQIREQLERFLHPDPLIRASAEQGASRSWFDEAQTREDKRNLLFILEYCFMRMEVSVYEDTIHALNHLKIR